jgi:hypothetical protein
LQDADLRADRTMFASIGLDDDAIDWRTPSVNNQKRSSALATESASQSTTASTWRGETSSPGGWGTLEIDDGASSNSAQVDEIMPGYKLVGPGSTSPAASGTTAHTLTVGYCCPLAESLSVVERPRPPNYRSQSRRGPQPPPGSLTKLTTSPAAVACKYGSTCSWGDRCNLRVPSRI